MRCARGTIASCLVPAMLGMGAAHGGDMFAPGRTGQIDWHIGAGKFTPANNSPLGDQEGRFDLLRAHQNVDTQAAVAPPSWGAANPHSSLDVGGIAGGRMLSLVLRFTL
ncbi:MAG TPA: hypothetical protein VFR06_01200 [Gallionellaceae bacterium]|nr:hypothetical protein [Gallionellaceae bacterium]